MIGTVFSLISTWALLNNFEKLEWVLLNGVHLKIYGSQNKIIKSLSNVFVSHTFFISNSFITNARLKLAKKLSKW